MTNRDTLLGITGFPVPERTIEAIALRRDIDLNGRADRDVMAGRAFRLCEADILMWLSRTPNVSQGGQSYTFSEAQRAEFAHRARGIYSEQGETVGDEGILSYGYKGEFL